MPYLRGLALALTSLSAGVHAVVLLRQNQTKLAPPGGAPFHIPLPLETLPTPREDALAAEYLVNRVNNMPTKWEQGPADACSIGVGKLASKDTCLTVPNRACLWVRLKSHDPRPLVPNEESYCMPCELDGEEMPCWNSGAWLGAKQVVECEMSCKHQKHVIQPQYSCSDFTGLDSQPSCFGRGEQTNSKCMFITYKDEAGAVKSSCSPCELEGVGKLDCPAVGANGPEGNSTVALCASQCEAPRPEAGLVLVAPVVGPGLGRTAAGQDEMVSAPVSPPLPPAEGATALATRAQVMDVMTTAPPYPPPPPEYFPMVVFKTPQDYSATTIPPLPEKPLGLEWPVELPQ